VRHTRETQMVVDKLRVLDTPALIAFASDSTKPWTARKIAYAIYKGRSRNEGKGKVCIECFCFNCICSFLNQSEQEV